MFSIQEVWHDRTKNAPKKISFDGLTQEEFLEILNKALAKRGLPPIRLVTGEPEDPEGKQTITIIMPMHEPRPEPRPKQDND